MAVVPSGGRAQRVSTAPTLVDSAAQATELREAMSGDFITDPYHSVEDLAYTNLTTDYYGYQTGLDFAPQARKLQVTRARYSWRTYPLAKQAIRLFANFVLGSGVAFHSENKAVQTVLDDFWSDPLNRRGFTSMIAQKRALVKRQVDGELFLFLFTDEGTGRVKVRVADPLQIEEIITDPEDADRPLYYERRWQPRAYEYGTGDVGGRYIPPQTAQRVDYYADAANADLPDKPPSLQDARVLHSTINALGSRGVSDLYAALDWLTAHRTFMEDRATLTHAMAKVAWTKKVKGGPAQVAASAALERSSLSALGASPLQSYEQNPPAVTGSTFVSNDGVTLNPMKVDSGAGNAEIDGRMLTIQIGASMGLMIHYFGDGGDANLATATAMNLPMLQMFKDGQEGWGDLLVSLFHFVILAAIKAGALPGDVDNHDGVEVPLIDGEPAKVTIEFPLIVREEVLPTVQALDVARKDGLVSQEFGARKALSVLGADNIDDEVEAALAEPPPLPPGAPPIAPGQQPAQQAGPRKPGQPTTAQTPPPPAKKQGAPANADQQPAPRRGARRSPPKPQGAG